MRKSHKKGDWVGDKQTVFRFQPEGWVDDLVFEVSDHHGCGLTKHGIGIRINDDAGGVLTLDDVAQIRDLLNEHLKSV